MSQRSVDVKIGADTSGFLTGISDVVAKLNVLNKQMLESQAATKKINQEMREYEKEQAKIQKEIKEEMKHEENTASAPVSVPVSVQVKATTQKGNTIGFGSILKGGK